MNRTMSVAKHEFEIGYLKSFSIDRHPLSDGWWVMLGSSGARGFLCDARTKEPRLFKSLDGAVSAVESIGFKVSTLS